MSKVIKFTKANKTPYPEVVKDLTNYLLEEADLPNQASHKDNIVKFQKTSSGLRPIQIPTFYWSVFTSSFILNMMI